LPRDKSQHAKPRWLSAVKRRKLIKDIRSVAKSLKAGSSEIRMATFAAAKHVVPSPESDDPPPVDLLPRQKQVWLKNQRRLTASKLADALLAMSIELDGQDHRKKPSGRHEQPETKLAAELVTWLRVATGAPWNYVSGGPIPPGGRPCYDVAAAFVQAAGWRSMTTMVVKARLEARTRA
jgi:hypothetical protein